MNLVTASEEYNFTSFSNLPFYTKVNERLLDLAEVGKQRKIVDLGCGTGILGIAAAKAMRARVIGSDIDPIAVAKARENVRVNGVSAFMRTYESRGLDAVMVRRHGPFGLVLANILARPLERLAPLIAAHRASGAPVILSGLLRTQEPQVIAAYRRAGLHLRARIHHDEWSTLICG